MTPEQGRVRNYLLTQGQKYSFEELWFRMIKARVQLIEELYGVNEAQAEFTPSQSEWTIAEVVHHVVLSTERVALIIEELVNGNEPDTSGVEPPKMPAVSGIGRLKKSVLDGAIRWSAMTQRLPSNPNYKFMACHSFFGDLHAGAWYLFQRVHDLDHVNQIASLKGHLHYPGK